MNYGHFDDQRREYVITNPQTPFPWINYLGNGDFFSIISQSAGGYAFYKDARLRRLTRYRYNSVPVDDGGRYYYIKDGDSIWNPGWKPMKTELDSYECRHGMGYTRFISSKQGVESELTCLVPMNTNAEVHQLKLTNTGNAPRNLQIFSLVEFALWNALDDMTNFQRNLNTGEVFVRDSAIFHVTEYRERRNHYSYYWANKNVTAFDTDRNAVLGKYNGFDEPQAIRNGSLGNSIAHGWHPVGAHQIDISLSPGESAELCFVLGYGENPQEEKWLPDGSLNTSQADRTITRFEREGAVAQAIEELQAYWAQNLDLISLSSNSPEFDRMVNTWHPYQCLVTFNLARSASLFESGIGRGIGFRDTNQDLLGSLHQIPQRAKQRILDVAGTQKSDGSAYHQYQPLTKKGNNEIGDGFNDDPLWLIGSTAAYIKETGDWSLLDENLPFSDTPEQNATLFDHLRASFHFTVDNRGPHRLPLIGRADWNDCLNLNCHSMNPDESFQTTGSPHGSVAESLMIAGSFVFFGKDYVDLCLNTDRLDEAKFAESALAEMREAIVENGWDGQWFLRAYDANGKKIGSADNPEGKIFIESQGFCSMALADSHPELVRSALDSVDTHLNTPYGIVILDPPYSSYNPDYGEISSYPPGYKENGGVFCHNNPWVMIGEAMLGRGEKLFQYYSQIAPAFQHEHAELHTVEPYVYCQMIAGKAAELPGEGKNSWLTGTAAWNFVVASQWILGLKPDYQGLRIDPCVPSTMKSFSMKRIFRGATYNIEVDNSAAVQKGIRSIEIDGQTIEGNVLPLGKAGESHAVKVVMG